MPSLRSLFSALILASWIASLPATAEDRVLFTLEASLSPQPIVVSIADVPEVQHPDPIPTSARWILKPGDRLRVDAQPADRTVDIFTGTALAPTLLCRIVIRYYLGKEGWIPQFRLEEQPAVAFIKGRWRPVGNIGGLVQFGNTPPNGDGFLPTFEFGGSSGDLPIVAWQVH